MKGIFMDKSLKKGFIINRFPVVIYFVLIFATLMVVISALAPVNNHEKKHTVHILIFQPDG